MLVRFGRIRSGITRVPEGFPVLRPGEIAAGGWILHACNRRADLFPARHLVHMQRAVLAAVLRQRHGHELSVGRGHEPVDGGEPFGVECVGIKHDFPALRLGLGVERHQYRLLFRRVAVDRKDRIAAGFQLGIGGRCGGDELRQLRFGRFLARQRVEVGAGAGVLRIAPCLHFGIGGSLEPAIGIGDLRALNGIDGIFRGRLRRWRNGCGKRGAAGEKQRNGRNAGKQAVHGRNSPASAGDSGVFYTISPGMKVISRNSTSHFGYGSTQSTRRRRRNHKVNWAPSAPRLPLWIFFVLLWCSLWFPNSLVRD